MIWNNTEGKPWKAYVKTESVTCFFEVISEGTYPESFLEAMKSAILRVEDVPEMLHFTQENVSGFEALRFSIRFYLISSQGIWRP